MNDDKNCDCASFFSALNVLIVVGAFFFSPFVATFCVILWAISAWMLARPAAKPLTPDEKAGHDEELLAADRARHQLWVENQKTWARAIEAEEKLRQYGF
jgi:hypothetical protein